MRHPTVLAFFFLASVSPAQLNKTEIEAAEGAYGAAMLKEDLSWFEKNLASDYIELDHGRTFKRAKALEMLRDSFRTSRRRRYDVGLPNIEGTDKSARSTTVTTFVLEDTRPKPQRLPTAELKAQIRKTWTRKNGRLVLSRLEVLRILSFKELKG